MSDAALRLRLIERAREERDALDTLRACERAHEAAARAVDRDRDRCDEAARALAHATRACAEPVTATAWSLQVSAARRATHHRALGDAKVSLRASEARLHAATQALDEARAALAHAMERRRVVAARIEALADEERRRREALADEDADEAHAEAQREAVSARGA